MMTETQFLSRFRRLPNGEWACTKPIKINGHPSGPLMIEEGTSFSPGALFLGLDLAMELEHMAAKHRALPAQPPGPMPAKTSSDLGRLRAGGQAAP